MRLSLVELPVRMCRPTTLTRGELPVGRPVSHKYVLDYQGRSDGGISVYIPLPPKSVYLKFFVCGCSVSLQGLVNIYTHPYQIPGYASVDYVTSQHPSLRFILGCRLLFAKEIITTVISLLLVVPCRCSKCNPNTNPEPATLRRVCCRVRNGACLWQSGCGVAVSL